MFSEHACGMCIVECYRDDQFGEIQIGSVNVIPNFNIFDNYQYNNNYIYYIHYIYYIMHDTCTCHHTYMHACTGESGWVPSKDIEHIVKAYAYSRQSAAVHDLHLMYMYGRNTCICNIYLGPQT